jgi:hypothetical protein
MLSTKGAEQQVCARSNYLSNFADQFFQIKRGKKDLIGLAAEYCHIFFLAF